MSSHSLEGDSGAYPAVQAFQQKLNSMSELLLAKHQPLPVRHDQVDRMSALCLPMYQSKVSDPSPSDSDGVKLYVFYNQFKFSQLLKEIDLANFLRGKKNIQKFI